MNIADWTRLNRGRLDYATSQALSIDVLSSRRLPDGKLYVESMEPRRDDPPDVLGLNVKYRDLATSQSFFGKLNDARMAKSFDDRKDQISFSGADFQTVVWFPLFGAGGVYQLNTLQTITMSTFRDLIPGRILGRAAANGYARGTRTMAGSIVMVMAEEQPFAAFLSTIGSFRSLADAGENPFYLDRIPPFWIIMTACSEVETDIGEVHAGSLAIRDVSFVSNNTTLSVNDIYTESVYNYVAEDVMPFAHRDLTDVLAEVKSIVSLQRSVEDESVRQRYLKYSKQELDRVEAISKKFSDPGSLEREANWILAGQGAGI